MSKEQFTVRLFTPSVKSDCGFNQTLFGGSITRSEISKKQQRVLEKDLAPLKRRLQNFDKTEMLEPVGRVRRALNKVKGI